MNKAGSVDHLADNCHFALLRDNMLICADVEMMIESVTQSHRYHWANSFPMSVKVISMDQLTHHKQGPISKKTIFQQFTWPFQTTLNCDEFPGLIPYGFHQTFCQDLLPQVLMHQLFDLLNLVEECWLNFCRKATKTCKKNNFVDYLKKILIFKIFYRQQDPEIALVMNIF